MLKGKMEAQPGCGKSSAGIVEEMGRVKELTEVNGGWELTVDASTVTEDAKVGCKTVVGARLLP